MLKKILFALILVVGATVTHAESDLKTAASKAYVDTSVETLQDKIPAANQQGIGLGETVMTYTAAGNGAIGERGIYTGANGYDASTDGDKLITASALNDTFTNLPTKETTKLECANLNDGCTLWTIVDQTAYGKSVDPAILAMLTALVNVEGDSECYKVLSNGSVIAGTCSPVPSGYGDWGVVFPYNDSTVQVNGISACSSVNESLSQGGIPTNQSGVRADYGSNMSSPPTSNPAGTNCYCKLTSPASSSWVFRYSYDNPARCAERCAHHCADGVHDRPNLRGGIFGTVTQ